MKKKILLLLCLGLIFVLPLASFAEASQFYKIDIDVELLDNGEAIITEIWDVDAQEGTEIYLVKENLDENDISVTDLKVKDERGTSYEILENWDTEGSILDKENKAGYNYTDSGVELCFGIGSYGRHTYTISYKMKNLLVQYTDLPGFHIRFVNDQLSSPVQDVEVRIHKKDTEFTAENAKIWAFGFEGKIEFDNGQIVAQSESPLNSWNYVNILASFDESLFSPAFKNPKSFEEVKELAFEGSDYLNQEEGDIPTEVEKEFVVEDHSSSHSGLPSFAKLLVPLFTASFIALLFGISAMKGGLSRESKAKLREVMRNRKGDYVRDTPLEGNLVASHELLVYMNKARKNNLVSAYLLDWIRKGYIRLETVETSSLLGLSSKEETSIAGLGDKGPPNGGTLYNILVMASGGDRILQEKEFSKWSRRNPEVIEKWYEGIRKSGKKTLEKRGIITIEEGRGSGFSEKADIFHLTDLGFEKAGDLLAFENFLKDFTLLDERVPMEVEVWEEYLVYAALFGIADEVAKSFEKLQPDFFAQSKFGTDYDSTLHTLALTTSLSSAVMRSSSTGSDHSSSFGGGGSSSIGGGGGFSGGGSGGGIR